jgi:hypothetical protein
MGDAVADLVLVVGELSPALRRFVLAACEQAQVHVVDLHDVEVVPVLACEPVLVVAALPTGSRVVPPALAALLAHELPDVPLCLFSDEHLVRPSITLNDGRLYLVGAPLGELRVTAWVQALLRPDRACNRERSVASVIGGRVCTIEQRRGALALATVSHDGVDAPMPQPSVEATIGRVALLALGPPGSGAPSLDANGCLNDCDGVVGLSVDRRRALRINVGRDDTEVRVCS